MARESLTSPGIVLRTVPYRDADLIVTLFTEARGRVSALARSARKSKRRFGSSLRLLTISEMELTRRGGELWTLGSARMLTSYADLATDIASFAHASYGTEIVRELSAAEQPDPRVFALLVELYRELEERGPLPLVLRAFELEMLALAGLAPVLDTCVGCGRGDIEGRNAVLDPNRGGVCCGSCAAISRGLGVRPISHAALHVLRAAQRVTSLQAARDVSVAEPGAALEARDTLVALVLMHVGKPLRSLEFIAKVSGATRHRERDS